MKVSIVVGLLLFASVAFSARHPIAHRDVVPTGWTLLHTAEPHDTIQFSVLLKQRNLDDLHRIFVEVSDPKSAKWGQFYTPAQLGELLRPADEAFQAVRDWLKPYQHIQVIEKDDYVSVKTSAQVASQLFDTPFHYYSHTSSKKTVLRAFGKATLPENLKEHVDFVAGISEFFMSDAETTFLANKAIFDVKATPIRQARATDPIVTPALLKQYYNVSSDLVATNPNNVQGIAAFTDYFSLGALQTFDKDQNLPLSKVIRDGPDCMPDCDQYESDLDIQYITAMGSGVPTIFLNQPANYWVLQFAQMATEMTPMPLVFSVSYGWPELFQCDIAVYVCQILGYSSELYVNRTNDEFQKVGAAGITVLVSDGDDGAPNLGEASGNCPVNNAQYCPIGGCAHTTSACASFQAVNNSNGALCQFPMGTGNSQCAAVLNDQNFNNAVGQFITTNAACQLTFDTDYESNPHFYSSCDCSKLQTVTAFGYTVSQFIFDQSIPVFTADYPTSSPYVTSVGATQFTYNSKNQLEEIVASILTGAIITTGGGFSSFQPMPDYQSSFVASYVETYLANQLPYYTYNPAMRAYPDIVFNGHHYKIFYSNSSSDSCPCIETEVDGTSCSSPALAGLISLLNDQLLNSGLPQLGFLNYALYEMAALSPDTLNDITTGINNCNRAYCCEYGYEAVPGWDAASGLGSPNFQAILDYIQMRRANM